MKKKTSLAVLVLAFWLSFSAALIGQENKTDNDNPLSSFSKLIGGKWVLGNSYQVFEWGVGKLSVNSRNFFVVDGSPKLVAEGNWIWHPGEKKIKGNFTAIQMPAVLFEYVTRFEDSKMINELTTYNVEGNREDYTEIWEFVDEDSFKWTLFSNTSPEPTIMMEGIYLRQTDRE